MSYKYQAFISYSHVDKKWADWLHKTLETYKIPALLEDQQKETGLRSSLKLTPIFRDREELPTSSGLSNAITDALTASKYLIVICSPNSAKSTYVNQEIIDFKSIHGEDRVLAIIVEGEPYATEKSGRFDSNQEAFPQALKFRVDKEKKLTDEKIEPIAADARDVGDGKERAKTKLIAGLLGVGFDDLWKREERRKKKRRTIWFSIVTVIFTMILSLSIFSLFQWKEAEYQKNIAVEGREAAEKLVEHTLFDLRDKLEPIGQLEVLYSTQKAVDEYYKKLSDLEFTPELEFRLSTYHANSANYFKSIGKTKEAMEHFEIAMRLMQKIVRENPKDILHQRNLLATYNELGSMQELLGELDRAKEYIDLSHKLLEKMVNNNKNNYYLQFDLAKNYAKKGSLFQHSGKIKEAKTSFEKALKMMKKLLHQNPQNKQWRQDLAVTHVSLGNILNILEEPGRALIHFETSLKIRTKLLEEHPSNTIIQHGLVESYNYLGATILSNRGAVEEVKSYFEKSLEIMKKLTIHDPINSQWQHSLARTYHKFGDLEGFLNNIDNAIKYYREELKILKQMIVDDPSNKSIQQEFALVSGSIGNMCIENNKLEKAKHYLERGLETILTLIKNEPNNSIYKYTQALIYQDLSRYYHKKYSILDLDNFYLHLDKMVREGNYENRHEKIKKGNRYFEESIKILKDLEQQDPNSSLWK